MVCEEIDKVLRTRVNIWRMILVHSVVAITAYQNRPNLSQHYQSRRRQICISKALQKEWLLRNWTCKMRWTRANAILNGDLITGENTYKFNATKNLDVLVKPIVQGDYRWASTYGNHDSKFNLSREALYAEERKYSNAYTQHGPSGTDGVTNYVLPVFPPGAQIKGESPVALLWFFDSRGGAGYQHEPANQDNIPDYVSEGTVAWFRSKQQDLQVGHS